MKKWILMAASVVALSATTANAEEFSVPSLRCGTDLLKLGDSTSKMLKTCGQPVLSEALESAEGGVVATNYHYQFSKSSPATVIQIKKGKVVEIIRDR
ncbi:DUF2845 domain-containing protein [uncultured Ferrimonas sp.]|uniref:DUF2845 domain-containing protein n=1 Tax=uncultured Ferrimonas sp. TaxID=432640 RepID=UPI00261CE6FB|nr:DUF2845 domain-containing protein [uncultured Ferrimonas sp.]